ncbi:hypothetical protein CF319_g8252 [Tilletia indica]|uniref:Uncharacterized protein n=1 Tax=Tilletia indica TaxID=43049 RepID=A0A177SZL0_9BASI|nr:hypothetical protein CF319_g8252 [Tilletia indica]KAE8238072.1 hypothetical protein A4X13_0g8529 [Tilletia indica]
MDEDPDSIELKGRENQGEETVHKPWLGSTLAGGRRRRHKTRQRIRRCVDAASSADHITSWLVAFIIQREWDSPSLSPEQPSRLSSFETSMELLSHDKGT